MACTRTYVGLCIYSTEIGPAEISRRLGVESSRSFDRDPNSRYKPNRDHNFWLWSTQDSLDSTDHIDHLNALFARFEGAEAAMESLRSSGCTTSISCYWDSNGQGGPWLDVRTIRKLAEFGADIWWDVYFDEPKSEDGA
jgi:hypothetical protein